MSTIYDAQAILVVGSRSIDKDDIMRVEMAIRKELHPDLFKELVFINGGCPSGVDKLALDIFKSVRKDFQRSTLRIVYPMWKIYGRSAGYLRNKRMHEILAEYENRCVIIIWDGKSKGTFQSFDLARKYDNPIIMG